MENDQNNFENCYKSFTSFFENFILKNWKTGFENFQKIEVSNINNLNREKQVYIRDPIWGEIRLNQLEKEILDSFFLQRLRDITQMGGIKFIYPAANHKRFDHSLGTFAAISFILNERILKRRQENFFEKIVSIFNNYQMCNPTLAAKFGDLAISKKKKDNQIEFEKSEFFRIWILLNMKLSMLMHDIGHYPFSHFFEIFLKRNQNIVRKYRNDIEEYIKNPHEFRSRDIILGRDPVLKSFVGDSIVTSVKDKIQNLGLDVDLISESITGDSEFILSKLVNGVLDADKLDYLTRDNYFAIASFPLNVFDRIYRKVNFKIVDEKNDLGMVFDEKAISAILKIIINRTFEFNDIINHPVSLCFQGMFHACLERIFQLYDMSLQVEILERMELMNDEQLIHSIAILANGDNFTNDLLYRIKYRKLYKQVVYYSKSDFSSFIKLMREAKKESLFIDAESFELCVSTEGKCHSEFKSLIDNMEKYNSGILIFYSENAKSISGYFNKIWIDLKNEEKLISLNELVNKRYLNRFNGLSLFCSKEGNSVADLFDIFSTIDDKIYIYTAKQILNEAKIVFEHLENSKGALNNFFNKITECIPTFDL